MRNNPSTLQHLPEPHGDQSQPTGKSSLPCLCQGLALSLHYDLFFHFILFTLFQSAVLQTLKEGTHPYNMWRGHSRQSQQQNARPFCPSLAGHYPLFNILLILSVHLRGKQKLERYGPPHQHEGAHRRAHNHLCTILHAPSDSESRQVAASSLFKFSPLYPFVLSFPITTFVIRPTPGRPSTSGDSGP